jgi:hypothetical protein
MPILAANVAARAIKQNNASQTVLIASGAPSAVLLIGHKMRRLGG